MNPIPPAPPQYTEVPLVVNIWPSPPVEPLAIRDVTDNVCRLDPISKRIDPFEAIAFLSVRLIDNSPGLMYRVFAGSIDGSLPETLVLL